MTWVSHRKYKVSNNERVRAQTQRARARSANGRQQTAKTTVYWVGYKQFKEKAWKTTKELERHHTLNSSLSTEMAGVDV